jgi:hypothetical protein
MNFYEFHDDLRISLRRAISLLGGDHFQYIEGGLRVAMPVNGAKRQAIVVLLDSAGLDMTGSAYFPLGSDQPAEELRHRFMQPPNHPPGYWLFYTFTIRED